LLLLLSCNNCNEKQKINNNEINQWTITVDNSIITFEKFNDKWWENVRKLIYSNFDDLIIEAGNNINFINWLNNFNWNQLLIHVNKNIFWVDFLKKIKWAKWKILSFGILSDNDTIITISDEEAKIYDKLNFENKNIILSVWKKIWTINCDENTKKILKDNCKN